MDYFCPPAGTETPRFTYPLPDLSECVPTTPKFHKINTGGDDQATTSTITGSPFDTIQDQN